MTQKQLVATGLITTLVLTLLMVISEADSNGILTGLIGLGFWVFGIWASILLLKK